MFCESNFKKKNEEETNNKDKFLLQSLFGVLVVVAAKNIKSNISFLSAI